MQEIKTIYKRIAKTGYGVANALVKRIANSEYIKPAKSETRIRQWLNNPTVIPSNNREYVNRVLFSEMLLFVQDSLSELDLKKQSINEQRNILSQIFHEIQTTLQDERKNNGTEPCSDELPSMSEVSGILPQDIP